MSLFLLF